MKKLFKATISDARQWKNLLAAISTLIEEADFNAAPEGIKIRSMDPSHVAMVDFECNKSAFQEYTCLQPTKIRLNIGDIVKKLRGPDQNLSKCLMMKIPQIEHGYQRQMEDNFHSPDSRPW